MWKANHSPAQPGPWPGRPACAFRFASFAAADFFTRTAPGKNRTFEWRHAPFPPLACKRPLPSQAWLVRALGNFTDALRPIARRMPMRDHIWHPHWEEMATQGVDKMRTEPHLQHRVHCRELGPVHTGRYHTIQDHIPHGIGEVPSEDINDERRDDESVHAHERHDGEPHLRKFTRREVHKMCAYASIMHHRSAQHVAQTGTQNANFTESLGTHTMPACMTLSYTVCVTRLSLCAPARNRRSK